MFIMEGLGSEGRVTKGQKESFENDSISLILIGGDGFTGVSMYQNIRSCTAICYTSIIPQYNCIHVCVIMI